jgi:cation diffusion facilitator family transporter
MSADGFHSLSDGTSNIIGIIGIRLASQPKDEDHPYGHRKYETLFSMAIGALLMFLAFNLAKEGVIRLYKPVIPNIDIMSFAVMIITLAVNIVVMRYEYKKGKDLNSDILVSDSLHTKADIFTSISVIAAFIAIKAGFPIVDPIVTIMIALFITYAAFEIFKDSSRVLCDTIAITDVKKIEEVVLSVKGVENCLKIRTRGRSDDINVDLHVQVDPKMQVGAAHEICYEIEDSIKKVIPGITDVIVHVEPKD